MEFSERDSQKLDHIAEYLATLTPLGQKCSLAQQKLAYGNEWHDELKQRLGEILMRQELDAFVAPLEGNNDGS